MLNVQQSNTHRQQWNVYISGQAPFIYVIQCSTLTGLNQSFQELLPSLYKEKLKGVSCEESCEPLNRFGSPLQKIFCLNFKRLGRLGLAKLVIILYFFILTSAKSCLQCDEYMNKIFVPISMYKICSVQNWNLEQPMIRCKYIRGYIKRGNICRQFNLLIWTSFFGQFVHALTGRG